MSFNIDALSLEDLAGQVLCPDIYPTDDPAEVEKMIKKSKPGGLFMIGMTKEQIKMYTDMANKYTNVPVIIASDVENGPEIVIKGSGTVPKLMACGAADDPEIMEEAGEIIAELCRENGVHWTFSPVVDINYNFRSPSTNNRSASDDPDHVIKISGALVKGLEKKGYMAACPKHFPAGGCDDRNPHFCTVVCDMTQEEWLNTYGRVHKTMIDANVGSIMIAHCALPAFEKECDPVLGCPPAVLSKSLLTDLLRNKLGFKGCIVSDAMSMVGACAMCPPEKLAITFLNAGGDVVLFNEKNDNERIVSAVKSGELPLERLKDAVGHMIALKEKVGLIGKEVTVVKETKRDIKEVAQIIADKSISLVRNCENIIPFDKEKMEHKGKVLFVNVVDLRQKQEPTGHEFDAMKDEFEKNGYTVDVLTTPKHREINEIVDNYDAVLVNYHMAVDNYHGGTNRVGWNNVFHFWRGYILRSPRIVCTSFGDPYRLYDIPFAKTYINAYSCTDESQRATAKVIMGKIPALGKSPVELKGYFKREV
ncbi:MAG: hypothetical protein IKV86_04240 [Clostridia bacterium]|nr:hypothetical protein [Clostridia bacterium]